jgi:hypothetical protein
VVPHECTLVRAWRAAWAESGLAPAVEQFGGGVFIQFLPEALSKWLSRQNRVITIAFACAGAWSAPGPHGGVPEFEI